MGGPGQKCQLIKRFAFHLWITKNYLYLTSIKTVVLILEHSKPQAISEVSEMKELGILTSAYNSQAYWFPFEQRHRFLRYRLLKNGDVKSNNLG